MTSAFSWQNSISLCPASFRIPRPNLPVTPGVSFLPTFAFQSPTMKRTSFLGVSSKRSCRSSSDQIRSVSQLCPTLCNQRWRSSILLANTRLGADCGSDHELLIAKFRLKLKKVGKTTRPFRYDLNQYNGSEK